MIDRLATLRTASVRTAVETNLNAKVKELEKARNSYQSTLDAAKVSTMIFLLTRLLTQLPIIEKLLSIVLLALEVGSEETLAKSKKKAEEANADFESFLKGCNLW